MLFKELKYVIAVQENGSISSAAKELFISEPALSKYLKNLEESLNVKLFEKKGRKLYLTESGRRYTDVARQMIDLYDNLFKDLDASDDTINGTLKIGATIMRGPMFIPKIIPEFNRRFPNVEISMYEDNSDVLEAKLYNGEIDFIIEKDPVNNSDSFTTIPLFREELLFAIPDDPEFLQKYFPDGIIPDKVNPVLFKNEVFCLLKPGHHTRYMADLIFSKNRCKPDKILSSTHMDTILSLTASIKGVSFVPSYYVNLPAVRSLRLRFLSIESQGVDTIFSTFHIVYRKNFFLNRYSRAFIEITKNAFREENEIPSI